MAIAKRVYKFVSLRSMLGRAHFDPKIYLSFEGCCAVVWCEGPGPGCLARRDWAQGSLQTKWPSVSGVHSQCFLAKKCLKHAPEVEIYKINIVLCFLVLCRGLLLLAELKVHVNNLSASRSFRSHVFLVI